MKVDMPLNKETKPKLDCDKKTPKKQKKKQDQQTTLLCLKIDRVSIYGGGVEWIWHIDIHEWFNAKSIFIEGLQWRYLTNTLVNMVSL